ncbi:MAG: leucyl aminopeptidase [Planctomycetaceae bacterium]|nr:leucyl aminopeptidase [Planctomycetaceae bacterium]
MDITVATTSLDQTEVDWLVLPLGETDGLGDSLQAVDKLLGGSITRLIETGDLTGKLAETVVLLDVPQVSATRIMLLGLGKAESASVASLNKAFMTGVRKITGKKPASAAIALPESFGDISQSALAQAVATALIVGGEGQGLYKSEPSRHELQAATLLVDENASIPALNDVVLRGSLIGESVNITRELVNRPAADIYPESVAERASQLCDEFSITCRVLDENDIANERMGSLSQVAVGSDRPPRIVVLEHLYGDDAPTIAFVGKGVTFDSGGLSMKSSDGMMTMKSDMPGSASVLGAVIAIARLGLSVNVIGYMGLVENMVSGRSYKLGDVLTARNGTTIEVHNTDAEGRLVLADVLSYAVDQGADKIIDLATLTGACVVALGEDVTGAFSNDQAWCDSVLDSASRCGEDAWQLPMFDLYDELLKSEVADCKNIGGRWGGAITAAKFLEKFVRKKPWVHLDIAGPSFASSSKGHREGGATGCMVKTLIDVAEQSQ